MEAILVVNDRVSGFHIKTPEGHTEHIRAQVFHQDIGQDLEDTVSDRKCSVQCSTGFRVDEGPLGDLRVVHCRYQPYDGLVAMTGVF